MKHIWILLTLFGFDFAHASSLNATLELTPNGQQLGAMLRLDRISKNQLLIWIWQENPNRQAGQPSAHRQKGFPVEPRLENGMTVYRFTSPINQNGTWLLRGMVGAGQAGFIVYKRFVIENVSKPSSIPLTLENNFDQTVPSYVQPLGYTVFGLVALFAFGFIGFIVHRLEKHQGEVI